jgi:hypothetical protein
MSTFDRQNMKKFPRLGLRVSEHAMLRFRERVEEEFLHRSTDDLADLLNERVRAAVLSREVVDPREPSIPTMLHLFEARTGARLVAVVREKCVVTVLDDWMARSNYPGWEEGTPPAPLGSILADKIRALAIVPSSLPPSPPIAPSPPAPEPPIAAAVVQPDAYGELAAECRSLGQRLRALRDRRTEIDAEIDAIVRDYEEKRGRLIAMMDEGV